MDDLHLPMLLLTPGIIDCQNVVTLSQHLLDLRVFSVFDLPLVAPGGEAVKQQAAPVMIFLTVKSNEKSKCYAKWG